MKRVMKKTISFCIAMVLMLGIVIPSVSAYSIGEDEYILKVIAQNEYSDAVRFGKGFLMLKDGKFNNVTSKTKYFYVDDAGNTREIKNTIGFTEVYLNTSGTSYYVEDGALAIGKDGKVAIMDLNGELYGGNENFYSCVVHAGDNLFYTTNASENYKDKADTTVWTLRTKDGKIVKQFHNLELKNRMHANGYEYVFYEEETGWTLISIDSTGTIKTIGSGYYSYYIDPATGYIVTKKKDSNYTTVNMGLFNRDGSKIFELDNCTEIDLSDFDKYGYARVSMSKETSTGTIFGGNLIDRNGKFLLPEWRYDSVKSYDNERVLAFDTEGTGYLMDHSQNIKFNSKDFAKKIGDQYEAISFSTYYVDSTLTVSLSNTKNETEAGKTFFLDKNSNITATDVQGYVSDFDGTFASIYDAQEETYGVTNKVGTQITKGYGGIRLERNKEVDIVARAGDRDGWGDEKILILKDGRVLEEYSYIDQNFSNGHAKVRNYKGQEGVLDKSGNEILKCGDYSNIILYQDTENFVAYKGDSPYLFDKNGKPLNKANQYKSIGDYTTTFYKFQSDGNNNEYKNPINSKDIAITQDFNNKFGLVQVRGFDWYICDVNKDDKIDIIDLTSVAAVYGEKYGQTGWKEDLDLNKDKIIDIYDLVLLSKKM